MSRCSIASASVPASSSARRPATAAPGTAMQLGTRREGHHVIALGRREGIDPLLLAEPERPRPFHRADDQTGRLIDVPVGVVPLRIGKGHHAIPAAGIADLLEGNRRAVPGMRVHGRNLAHVCPKVCNTIAVRLDVDAVGVAQRVVHHCECAHGHDQASLELEIREDGLLRLLKLIRQDIRLYGVCDLHTADATAQLTILGLSAGDESDLLLAGRDGTAGIGEDRTAAGCRALRAWCGRGLHRYGPQRAARDPSTAKTRVAHESSTPRPRAPGSRRLRRPARAQPPSAGKASTA